MISGSSQVREIMSLWRLFRIGVSGESFVPSGRVLLLGVAASVGALWCGMPVSAQPLYLGAWGGNYHGEATVPSGLTGVVAIAAGNQFNLILKNDGTVTTWGQNQFGSVLPPPGLSNVIAVAANSACMALKQDGTVVVWGAGPLPAVENVPPAATNVTSIANGFNVCLALRADGNVVQWGVAPSGSTNFPAGPSNVTAIAAGTIHSLALKTDGTVVAWGDNFYGQCNVPAGLSNVTAISAAQGWSMALKKDGTVVAWGDNSVGETNVSPGLSNVIAISAGLQWGLALKADGTVASWGYQTMVPPGLSAVTAISAGGDQNLALTTIPLIQITAQPQSVVTNVGATVPFQVSATCQVPLNYQWQKGGTNLSGATNSSLTITNAQPSDEGTYAVVLSHPTATLTSSPASLTLRTLIIAQPQNVVIPIGSNASFSVTAIGAPSLYYQWCKNGTNLVGQTGTNLVLASTQASDAGSYTVVITSSIGSVTSSPAILALIPSPFVLPSPSSVISLGGPAVPAGLDDIVAIGAGFGQQLAVRSNGTVVCWGRNAIGSPQPPAGLSNVVAVASGGLCSIALKSDGTVVSWGDPTGTPPGGLAGVVAIACGFNHTIALKSDGTTVSWGLLPIAPPVGNSNYVAIAAGYNFSTGIRDDGTVPAGAANSVLFGFNGASNVEGIAGGSSFNFVMLQNNTTVSSFGVSIPPGLSNVVAVSGGLALRNDGSVVALGGSTAPAGLTNVTAISGSVGNGMVLTRWPAILQPPQSQTVNAATPATLSVGAAGAPTLTYQWRKNGTNLSGATTTSITISNVQPADAGNYDVIVSNGAGSLTSTAATLTVNSYPAVTVPPQPAALWVGMRVDFNVSAVGAQPLSYRWLHGGSDLGAPNSPTLSLSNVQLSDAGNYSVVVTNSSGSVTSAPALLTVSSNTFNLSPPGTVVGLGGPVVPAGLTDVVAIGAGFGQQLAVRSNGTVVCWGKNMIGSPQPPADLSNVVAVSSGGVHSIALKRDGTVVGWGQNASLAGLFGVVAIASGPNHSIALKSDGTTVSWGILGIPPPVGNSNYIAIAAGVNFSTGIRSDGTVPPGDANSVLFGFNGASNVQGIAGGSDINFVMLQSNTTVSSFGVSIPPGLSNVVAVSGGLALRNDGTVVALGGGTVPPGLTNVSAISGGLAGGLVLTTNPPPPILGAALGPNAFLLSAPLSVPGYVLESADNPSGQFTGVDSYTNATTTNALALPLTGSGQFYRLRKP
jgi:alpha-tubulin suppressor-like RCC1 family protein